jgi:hypothetical protein
VVLPDAFTWSIRATSPFCRSNRTSVLTTHDPVTITGTNFLDGATVAFGETTLNRCQFSVNPINARCPRLTPALDVW